MSEKRIKKFRKKINRYKKDLMLEFLDGLKDVGIMLRIRFCFKILFTNFRLFDKKMEIE